MRSEYTVWDKLRQAGTLVADLTVRVIWFILLFVKLPNFFEVKAWPNVLLLVLCFGVARSMGARI